MSPRPKKDARTEGSKSRHRRLPSLPRHSFSPPRDFSLTSSSSSEREDRLHSAVDINRYPIVQPFAASADRQTITLPLNVSGTPLSSPSEWNNPTVSESTDSVRSRVDSPLLLLREEDAFFDTSNEGSWTPSDSPVLRGAEATIGYGLEALRVLGPEDPARDWEVQYNTAARAQRQAAAMEKMARLDIEYDDPSFPMATPRVTKRVVFVSHVPRKEVAVFRTNEDSPPFEEAAAAAVPAAELPETPRMPGVCGNMRSPPIRSANLLPERAIVTAEQPEPPRMPRAFGGMRAPQTGGANPLPERAAVVADMRARAARRNQFARISRRTPRQAPTVVLANGPRISGEVLAFTRATCRGTIRSFDRTVVADIVPDTLLLDGVHSGHLVAGARFIFTCSNPRASQFASRREVISVAPLHAVQRTLGHQ